VTPRSLALSRIGNLEVVELLSNVIAHLVEGEIMQMSNKTSTAASFSMDRYLQKSFLKTASLIAHAAKASALLGSYDQPIARAQADFAYQYGKHIGLACVQRVVVRRRSNC
jgi:geranylgeranyl pyrophosphate synthase